MDHRAAQRGVLLGRDAELSRLRALVGALSAGRGGAVLVEGEPGIGKSELLRAAAADATGRGCQVFWAAGDPLGTAFPLLPLLDAFAVRESSPDPGRAEVARALRGAYAGPGGGAAAAAAELLLALVDEVCAAAPVLLVVDDLQWADEATVGVWHRLARTVEQRALLVAGAMRPLPRRDDLKALRRGVGPRAVLRLRPLSDEAVTGLVADLAGARPGEGLRQLAAGAAGNPLYLTELVAALDRGGALTVAGGTAEVAGGTAPAELAEAIADRLDFLPGPAREAVRAAALLGEDFTAAALAGVLRRPVADLLPALDDARAAGVLVDTGPALAFRHPLIRAALYDELPATVRAAWHAEAAHALDQAGAPLEAVARQLLAAGADQGAAANSWLLDWLADNAEALTHTAPNVAAALLEPALTAAPVGNPRHDLLATRLAEAFFRLGRHADAARLATRTVARVADPDILVHLYDTLVRCRAGTQHLRHAVDEVNRAAATPGLRPVHRARLGVIAARARCGTSEFDAAEQLAGEALSIATEVGDRWAMGWALSTLGYVTGIRGRLPEALEAFERGLAVTSDDPALSDLTLHLMYNLAEALVWLDRVGEARECLLEQGALADRSGNLTRLLLAQRGLVGLLFATGQWDDTLAECELPDQGVRPDSACIVSGCAAIIEFHRGDTATAHRYLTVGAVHAERLDDLVLGHWTAALAFDREQSGHPQAALALLTTDTDQIQETEVWLADAVRLAVALGESATAAAVTARAETFPGVDDIPRRQAIAAHCRGLLDADPALLLNAADRYERAGRPLPRAQALEAAAVLLAERGEAAAARRHGNVALRTYTELGAAWDITRLRGALRARGARLGARAAERAAATGWDALTPTEAKVVDQLARGRSNPQIAAQLMLSRRTVETHVSHILRKLDLTSRVDIIVAAADLARRPPSSRS